MLPTEENTRPAEENLFSYGEANISTEEGFFPAEDNLFPVEKSFFLRRI
jgi:hypothetical protein